MTQNFKSFLEKEGFPLADWLITWRGTYKKVTYRHFCYGAKQKYQKHFQIIRINFLWATTPIITPYNNQIAISGYTPLAGHCYMCRGVIIDVDTRCAVWQFTLCRIVECAESASSTMCSRSPVFHYVSQNVIQLVFTCDWCAQSSCHNGSFDK